MYEYSIIREFFKHWAEYKEVELSKDDITILSFYGQEHYKQRNNGNKLFKNYDETTVVFDWDSVDEKEATLLVKIWNTYIHIITDGDIYSYVSRENNYVDIFAILKHNNRGD